MTDQSTNAKLLDELRTARADWDTLLAEVGEERMIQPGVAAENILIQPNDN